MRKSKAGERRKVQPQVLDAMNRPEIQELYQQAIADGTTYPPLITSPVAEPFPWEVAAQAYMPFQEAAEQAGLPPSDAELLFFAYHTSEHTRLLRAILDAVTME